MDPEFLPPDPYVHAHEQYWIFQGYLAIRAFTGNDKKGDGSNTDKHWNHYRAIHLGKEGLKIKSVKDLKG